MSGRVSRRVQCVKYIFALDVTTTTRCLAVHRTHTHTKMRLQVISDIHLEFRKNRYPYIPRYAPHIALLGDIGKPFTNVYKRLLYDLSRRFETVIVVAGNHEFYSSTSARKVSIGAIHDRIRSLAALFTNVHYLERQSLFIDGVRILGATLWTRIPPDSWQIARRSMNDYRMCFVDTYTDINVGIPLTPEHTTNWHEQTLVWLKEELLSSNPAPTIVLSHHAPYHRGTSAPQFDNHPSQCCYASDLSPLFHSPIVAWAYGHTHFRNDTIVNGVRLVSNPLGYPGELENEMDAIYKPAIISATNPAIAPPPGLTGDYCGDDDRGARE